MAKIRLQPKLLFISRKQSLASTAKSTLLFFLSTYFWSFVVVTTIFYSTLIRLTSLIPTINQQNIKHKIAIRWGRSVFRLIPFFWSFEVKGKQHLSESCYVIVANHSHLTDIWALYLTGLNFRWIAKAELFKVPFLGSAMKSAGYIPVNRRSRQSRANSIIESQNHLKSGNSMLVFPEGKRIRAESIAI